MRVQAACSTLGRSHLVFLITGFAPVALSKASSITFRAVPLVLSATITHHGTAVPRVPFFAISVSTRITMLDSMFNSLNPIRSGLLKWWAMAG